MKHTFNITKFAQQAKQLTELFGVDAAFATQVEQLLNSLDKNDKKYILKLIKDTPINSPDRFAELQRRIEDQKNLSAQKQQNVPTNKLNPETIAKIQRATNNKQHQQWMADLIVRKVAQDEDVAKLQLLLDEFTALCKKGIISGEQQNILNYKTDTDLYKIIEIYSQQEEGVFPPESLGYKVLDSNGTSKFLEIFTVEAMAAVAKMRKPMANWCVARNDVQYDPLRYYCLVVNGSPNILVHPESDQIRDYMDDPVSKAEDINMIYPYLVKYKLFPDGYEDFPSSYEEARERFGEDGENFNDYTDGDLEGDFAIMKIKKNTIDKISKNVDNIGAVSKILLEDMSMINCIQKDKWVNYFPFLYKYWGKIIPASINGSSNIIDGINKELFASFAKWIKINNLDYSGVERTIIGWIQKDGWGLVNYHSKIPDACKSKNVSEFYKKAISDINNVMSGKQNARLPSWCNLYVSKIITSGKTPVEWEQGALNEMNEKHPSPSNEYGRILSSMVQQNRVPENIKEQVCNEHLRIINDIKEAEKAYSASLEDVATYKTKEKGAAARLTAAEKELANKQALTEFSVQLSIHAIKNGTGNQKNHDIVMQRLYDELCGESTPFISIFNTKQILFDKEMGEYVGKFINQNYGKEPQEFLSSFFEYLTRTSMSDCSGLMGGIGEWFEKRKTENDPVFDRYMLNLCSAFGTTSFSKKITGKWIETKLRNKDKDVENMVLRSTGHLERGVYTTLLPEYIHDFLYNKLTQGEIGDEFISIISKRIIANLEPPSFATDWCFKTILSGKAPFEWIEAIDEKVFYIYESTHNLRLFSDNNFKVLLARHMEEIRKAYPDYPFIDAIKEQAKQKTLLEQSTSREEVTAKSWYLNYKLSNRF